MDEKEQPIIPDPQEIDAILDEIEENERKYEEIREKELNLKLNVLVQYKVQESKINENNEETVNFENKSTAFSTDITLKYKKLKLDMHFLFDGMQSTIMSQFQIYYAQKTDIETKLKINVVDIACGEGNYSRLISDKFNCNKIIGIDRSESQINLAKEKTNFQLYPNITYICSDLASIDSTKIQNETFDIALASLVYHYAENKTLLSKYIQSTYNILNNDGIVIGVTDSVKDINKFTQGIFQNNKKLGSVALFKDNTISEGPYIHKVGYNENAIDFNINLYSYSTYRELFINAGFKSIKFLSAKEYVHGYSSNKEEISLFKTYFDDKYMDNHNVTKIFVARK
eukprot:552106_1